MHLNKVQAARFNQMLDALACYANRERGIVPERVLADSKPGARRAAARNRVLAIVWREPELIQSFVASRPGNLTAADLAELDRWRAAASGPMTLLGFDRLGRALLVVGEHLVAAQGVAHELADLVPGKTPALVDAVLVPFGDQIVCAAIMRRYDEDDAGGSAPVTIDLSRVTAPIIERADAFVRIMRACAASDGHSPGAQDAPMADAPNDLQENRHPGPARPQPRDMPASKPPVPEPLPPGVHRGVLAGLAPAAREAAVCKARRVRACSSPELDALAELMARAQRHEPAKSLRRALATDSREELERTAHAHGITDTFDMRRDVLIRRLTERLTASAEDDMRRFLIYAPEDAYQTVRWLLAAPRCSVGFGESEAETYLHVTPVHPFTRLYLHRGRFRALIPTEYVEAARRLDLDAVAYRRSCLARAAHIGAVLVGLCGVVSIERVAERCEEVYGFPIDVRDVFDALRNAMQQAQEPPFALWRDRSPQQRLDPRRTRPRTPMRLRFGSLSDWYLIHPSMGDEAVKRGAVYRAQAEIARSGLNDLPEALRAAELERRFSYRWFRALLDDAFTRRDERVGQLLVEHERRACLGPCPIDASLAETDVPTWLRGLPEAVALRDWFDAHVPDDADDLRFADDALDCLLVERNASANPEHLIGVAAHEGWLELGIDADEAATRIRELSAALPDWSCNGWPVRALFREPVPW